MKPISVSDELPPDRTYVLVRYTGGNWHDSDDRNGCVWRVVKFVRGISISERDAMPESCERKRIYKEADENFNNKRPFCWKEFGPMTLFGQDVDCWMPLPEVELDNMRGSGDA